MILLIYSNKSKKIQNLFTNINAIKLLWIIAVPKVTKCLTKQPFKKEKLFFPIFNKRIFHNNLKLQVMIIVNILKILTIFFKAIKRSFPINLECLKNLSKFLKIKNSLQNSAINT